MSPQHLLHPSLLVRIAWRLLYDVVEENTDAEDVEARCGGKLQLEETVVAVAHLVQKTFLVEQPLHRALRVLHQSLEVLIPLRNPKTIVRREVYSLNFMV